MDHDVFIISGDFGLPEGETAPRRVFRTEREDRAAGITPTLEHLLTSAGERAIVRSGLDPDFLRRKISHLLATTMPEVKLEEMNLGLLSTRLKSSLKLQSSCQARFEVGSSDAGASTFATAWHTTRSAQEPRTTLVLAGQVMPGGSEAIRAISKVLEPGERRLGLNMLAVGDLYMDLFTRWWGLDECAAQLETDPAGLLQATQGPATAEGQIEALHRLIDRLTGAKLELAGEYLPANRRGAVELGPWSTPWFRIGHIAPATSGGAAILMTNDVEVVRAWCESRGERARLVRILGVGEGEQETSVGRRPHPFVFLKSIRQALSALGRDAGVNLDLLRSSSFALLHDAFLSIETAFLFALGMSPLASVQKQLSFWSNPYGGLTAFGHAIGASGLVQMVKAFQIFTHDAEMFATDVPSRHPRFDLVDGPVRALATSVGGPLSHIVAALLESVPLERDDESGQIRMPARFHPPPRHRFNPAVDGDLPQKAAWVQGLFEQHLERFGQGLGLLEARTSLDLRSLALPLPDEFLAQWKLPAVRTREGLLEIDARDQRQLKTFLAGGSSTAKADGAPDRELNAIMERIASAHLNREGGPPALETQVKALRDNLFAMIRPPMALVAAPDGAAQAAEVGAGGAFAGREGVPFTAATGGSPALRAREGNADSAVRRLVLLFEDVVSARPGTLVRLSQAQPYPLAVAVEHSRPGLVPLWDQHPDSGPGPFAPISLPPGKVGPVVAQLLRATPGRALWRTVRAMAADVVAQVLEHPEETPPPAAVKLLRALVLFPDSMPERVVEHLMALCCEDSPTTPGRDGMVAYCEIDLVGSSPLSGDQLARDLGIVARAIRRSECWLSFGQVSLERSGDHFSATCPLPTGVSPESAWVAMTRFARDVYQEALARNIRLRAGVSVGVCQRFIGIDGAICATGVTVRAVQAVLREAPEARRGYWSRGREGAQSASVEEHLGDGVILTGEDGALEAGWFDRVWAAVGGEVLEAVGEQLLAARAEGEDRVRYQYRARRTSSMGEIRAPTPVPADG